MSNKFYKIRPNWKIYYKIVSDVADTIIELAKNYQDNKEIIKILVIGDRENKKHGLSQFVLFHSLRL